MIGLAETQIDNVSGCLGGSGSACVDYVYTNLASVPTNPIGMMAAADATIAQGQEIYGDYEAGRTDQANGKVAFFAAEMLVARGAGKALSGLKGAKPLADDGLPTSRGATRTNAQFRSDGETVFHGHGSYSTGNGTIVVPEGTAVAFYGPHGRTITDLRGLTISGPGGPRLEPTEIAWPGDTIPNYTLAPLGRGFTFCNGSTVVDQRTLLSELLSGNMGICHWAACRSSRG